jgi:hypothetical protein
MPIVKIANCVTLALDECCLNDLMTAVVPPLLFTIVIRVEIPTMKRRLKHQSLSPRIERGTIVSYHHS